MIRFNRLTALALSTAVLLAFQPTAEAVNRVSNKANGDWNTAADWTPGAVPTSADNLGIGATAGAGAITPSTMGLNGGNAQSAHLYIGGGNIGLGGSSGTGTLNVINGANLWTNGELRLGGSGDGGTNNGTISLTDSYMIGQNTLYAARSSANGVATVSLNNSTLNVQGTNDSTYLSEASGTRATINLNNGSVLNIGNTGGSTSGGGTNQSVIIGGNNQNSYATINIDSTSQMNMGMSGSLFIRGGDPLGPTIHGLTQHAVYTLPMSNTMANGHLSMTRGLTLADQANRVILNLDSTLAPGLASATTLNQFGELRMANTSNSSAQLNMDDVDMRFYGGHMYMAAVNQAESNMRSSVNLTNSSLANLSGGLDIGKGATTTNGAINLVNSVFTVRDSINVGRDSSNTGTATFGIDANSQLNMMNGTLFLQGGNNGGNATYNLATADTASNGRMSFDRGLSIAQSPNNNITLNLTSATSDALQHQYGGLTIARGGNSTGLLTLTGMDMHFRSTTLQIANQQDQNNQQGTLTLTNSTLHNTAGGLEIGKGATTTLGTLNLNNSQLILRDSINVGRDSSNTGTALFNIDANSRLIMENGTLFLQGGNNGGNATYNLATADTASNGRMSFDRGLSIAQSPNNNITLNLTSATSDALQHQYGGLTIARGGNSTGLLTLTGMDMHFRSTTLQIANQQDQNNQQGTLTLTNSTLHNTAGGLEIGKGATTTLGTLNLNNSQLILRDGINVGRDSSNTGTAAFNIDANSRLIAENGALILRGGNNGGNATYNLATSDTPTNGKMSFDRGLTIADTPSNNITLNLTSATSDVLQHQYGGLTIARGTNANGLLNLTGMDMRFRSTTLQIANQQDQNNQQGELELNNSTLRNTSGGLDIGRGATTTLGTVDLNNSQLIVSGGISVGRDNANTGTALFDIDANSRLVAENGGLVLRGGNNGANQTYNLAVSDTASNGRMSFDRGLAVADTQSNRITLNLNSATSVAQNRQFGSLTIGRQQDVVGILNLTGMDMEFHAAGTLQMSNEQGHNNQQATLAMTNSSMWYSAGLDIGRGNTTTSATLNLANSTLNVRDSLSIGRDGSRHGFANITIDANSQLNLLRGSLDIRGGNNNATATYNLNLTDSFNPANNHLSFNGSLSVGSHSTSPDVVLNSVSNVRAMASGELFVGFNGSSALGTLNLDGTRLQFSSNGGMGNNANNRGYLTLTNGAGVQIAGDLTMRNGATASAASRITMNGGSASALDGGNSFNMSGRVVNNSAGVMSVDFGALSSSVTGTGNATQGDGTLSGWVVNPSSGGQIVLKSLRGVANSLDTTWGQQTAGTTPSLVNSMRVSFGGAAVNTVGDLAIGVVDAEIFNAGADKIVGAFDLQADNGLVLNNGPTLSVRYDSARATALAANEANLQFYQLIAGVWTPIASTVDTGNKRITSNVAINTSLGNVIIADSTSFTGLTTPETITPFDGNRAAGQTVRYNTASGNWDASGNWQDLGGTGVNVRRALGPEVRDAVEIGSSALASAAVTLNNGVDNRIRSLNMGTVTGTSSLTIDGAGTSLRITSSDVQAANNAGNSTASITVQNDALLHIDNSMNLATNTNNIGNLTINDGRVQLSGNLNAGRGQNSVANITLTNGALLDIRESLIVGADDGNNNGKAVISISADSQLDVRSSLFLRGREAGPAQAVYTLPLTGTENKGPGFLSVGGNLNIADGGNNRVSLTLDSNLAPGLAADTNIDLSGELNIGSGGNSVGNLTMIDVNASFGGGNMRLATGGNFTNTLSMTDSSLLLMGQMNLATANNDNTIAAINLVNSTIDTRSSVLIGHDNGARGRADISIDANSQFNVLGSLHIRGGHNNANHTYNLALTDTPTDGKLSLRSGLHVADAGNTRVTLNIDSTGAASAGQQSAATAYYDGELNIGSGGSSIGIVNMHNVNWAFGGGNMRLATGGNFTSQLNMTNSNLLLMGTMNLATANNDNTIAAINLVNSTIDTRSSVLIGHDNGARGRADISIDANSQFNVLGSLQIRGGHNNANHTYNLALTDTPTNGKLSFRSGLSVADGGNTRVTLNLDSTGANSSGQQSAATAYYDGEFNIGTGGSSIGNVNMHNLNWSFGGGTMRLATGGNFTSQLNLTNSTLNLMGSMEFARANNDNTIAALNLVNSKVDSRGQLLIGTDSAARGRADISIDANSQLNLLSSLIIRGGHNNANHTYNLPLAGDPSNGKLSFRSGLSVADGSSNRVTLNVDSTGVASAGQSAAAFSRFDGELNIGTGGSAIGIVNLHNVDWGFGGGTMRLANGGSFTSQLNLTNSNLLLMGSMEFARANNDNTIAQVNLVNSKIESRGQLLIGTDNNARGLATITMDGNSQFDILGSIILRGGSNNVAAANYTLPLGSTREAGRMTFLGNLNIADTNNNRVQVTVDSTLAPGQAAATDMSSNGNFSMSNGSGAISTMTLRESRMRFNSSGNFSQNSNAQSTLTLDDGHMEFYGGMNVRNQTSASTLITGTGSISVGGTLQNNGRIVADGGDLVLRANTVTRNTGVSVTQATGSFGQAGWFATNGGKLTLPDQYITGTTNSNWGGNVNDANPILVNSLRFTSFTNLQPGIFSGSVLAPDHVDLPPGLVKVVSAWELGGITFGNATMRVRFDDARAAAISAPEANLKLWHYNGTGWVNITSGAVDAGNNWIDSVSINSLSPFAVAESLVAGIIISPDTITLPTIITGGPNQNANISATEINNLAGNYNVGSPTGNFNVSGTPGVDVPIAALGVNNHTVSYGNTALVGSHTGSVVFDDPTNGNGDVGGSPKSVALQGTVLAHADPAFGDNSTVLNLDFGLQAANSGVYNLGYQIQNLLNDTFQATLDLDTINQILNMAGSFDSGAAPFTDLAPGDNVPFIASWDTTGLSPGVYNAQFTFDLADQNLPGAFAYLSGLTLNLQGTIEGANVIPEPSTIILGLLGLVGFGLLAWKKRPK